jgi:iron uptake system component EfeO
MPKGKPHTSAGAGSMKKHSLLVISVVVSCLSGVPAATRGTEQSARATPLEAAAGAFRSYVLEQVGQCLAAVRTMRDRIASHDLEGAQRAWLAARGWWESSEVVTAEYFPDLDRAIDGWPDADRGFHAIEARLFGAHSTDALPAADELVGNLMEFQRQLQSTTLTAQRLLSGVTRLTYEIGEDKAGGGESPFSGNSLAEIGSNVTAIAAAYHRVLAPAAKEKKAEFSVRIAAELDRLGALVAVPSLRELDQTALRELSEILTDDLAGLGQQLGLEKPSLGN